MQDAALDAEHSTKIQIPFVKYYFTRAHIVVIVHDDINSHALVPRVEAILKDNEIFLLISTD